MGFNCRNQDEWFRSFAACLLMLSILLFGCGGADDASQTTVENPFQNVSAYLEVQTPKDKAVGADELESPTSSGIPVVAGDESDQLMTRSGIAHFAPVDSGGNLF